MSKPAPRMLSVVRKEYVTPHMLRVTLGGEGFKDFPEDQESGYVKLIFPVEGGRLMRTYTIRHQRADEIDIDFAIHGDSGVACRWALHVELGEEILVGGPGPKKLAAEGTDWVIFVGDMTSLPAISVNLAALPSDTKGYALIEVQAEDDIQNLAKPENIEIQWIINPEPGVDSESLVNHVKQLTWLDGSLAVWAACEFSSMRALRSYFKDREEVAKSDMYVSSYWKQGLNEDQHKVEKRNDLETSEVA